MNALTFSKDRPAQLDLHLLSLRKHFPNLYKKTAALYRSTESRYEEGYEMCVRYHPKVAFVREKNFRAQVLSWIPEEGAAMLLCDDDVFYREIPRTSLDPEEHLENDPETLCFSLRLGSHTRTCYPLRREQRIPFSTYPQWVWARAEADFAYPGSCDGHVFRSRQLHTLLAANQPAWASPNELEDHLNRSCQTALLPYMRCYDQSVLVGVPVNSTQTVYAENRHSEIHNAPLATLNRHFLEGRRLSPESVVASAVDAAHVEVELLWAPDPVVA